LALRAEALALVLVLRAEALTLSFWR